MKADRDFAVQVSLEQRDDGSLRAWSDAVPELVLSGADAEQVLQDISKALAAILSDRVGGAVAVQEVSVAPSSSLRREFTAHAA